MTTEPLVLRNEGRTAVVFAYHLPDRNVRFFMRTGLCPDPLVDFYIVHNEVERNPEVPNEVTHKPLGSSGVTWIKRPNVSQDWGAFAAALAEMRSWERYDYFLFINSTMRGPILPSWYNHKEHWTTIFTRRLNDSVALTGSSINFHDCHPHVQSMMMCMDQRGLRINLARKVFWLNDRLSVDKETLIRRHEMGASKTLLDAGYNIDCLLQAFQGVDWRHCEQHWMPKQEQQDVWGEGHYYGYNIDPRETVFFKTNRSYRTDRNALDMLTDFMENVEYRQGQPDPATQVTPDDMMRLPVLSNADEVLWKDQERQDWVFPPSTDHREPSLEEPVLRQARTPTVLPVEADPHRRSDPALVLSVGILAVLLAGLIAYVVLERFSHKPPEAR